MLTTYAAGEPDMDNMRIVFIDYIKNSYLQENPEKLQVFLSFRGGIEGEVYLIMKKHVKVE